MNESRSNVDKSGQVLRYTILPEILPRFRQTFGSGFKTLAFLIASIFASVRILPNNHPYLRADNYQKFGLISVLAEGGRQVKWDRNHLDQMLVYFMILTCFLVLVLQCFIMASLVFTTVAMAGPPNDLILQSGNWGFFFDPFNAGNPGEQDYALRFLDLVFGLRMPTGVGSFFQSCVGIAAACNDHEGNALPGYVWPLAMHTGLHAILGFYNFMIIALAFVIFLYYVVTMAAETTVHGTLWGQRGNRTWIPMRAIFFCALIIPFYQTGDPANGPRLNLAQFLVLDAAYYGTGVASNAWREANDAFLDELAGPHDTLIADIDAENFPSSRNMVQFMSMVKTCAYGERELKQNHIDAYIVKNADPGGGTDNCLPLNGTTYQDALEFSNFEDIRIRFGERVLDAADVPIPCGGAIPPGEMDLDYLFQPGYVIPYCGEITLTSEGPKELGEEVREAHYTEVITNLWNDGFIDSIGEGFFLSADDDTVEFDPDLNQIRTIINARDAEIEQAIDDGVAAVLATPFFDIPASIGECGWVCASLYYNRIAEANGVMQSSIFAQPQVVKWPQVTEVVLAHRNMDNRMNDVCDMFSPTLPGREGVDFSQEVNLRVASIISNTHEYFCNNGLLSADFSDGGNDAFRYTMTSVGSSPVKDLIAQIFGVNGLFDMRQNVDIHPLAQLSLLGKGMVESTIRVFGFAVLGTMGQAMGLEAMLGNSAAEVVNTLTGVMTSIGMIGLTVGFVLYYVIPYLPFIYFFFAVVSWVKAIFEALVGVPLWALAHLRLDGEGIIGDAASSGYWLILEIFLRPFLILVGFLAGISIFMGGVKLLNDMFDLIVANVGGFYAGEGVSVALGNAPSYGDPFTIDRMRGPIDQFFYTVIYAIIVYMMALASFKMIDLLPNQILRWAGVGVKTFGDFAGDPAGNLISLVGTGIKTGAVLGGGLLGKVSRPGEGSRTLIREDGDPT